MNENDGMMYDRSGNEIMGSGVNDIMFDGADDEFFETEDELNTLTGSVSAFLEFQPHSLAQLQTSS